MAKRRTKGQIVKLRATVLHVVMDTPPKLDKKLEGLTGAMDRLATVLCTPTLWDVTPKRSRRTIADLAQEGAEFIAEESRRLNVVPAVIEG